MDELSSHDGITKTARVHFVCYATTKASKDILDPMFSILPIKAPLILNFFMTFRSCLIFK